MAAGERTARGWRAWLGNLTLLAVSVALGLLVLELAARVERRTRKGGKEQRERILYSEHDPLLGWHKRPGAQVVYDRRDYTVAVSINSHGLRDPERGYRPPPGATNVLALGDSFVEAFMVPLEQTVTQQFEAALERDRCRVRVVNGGTSGYSTDQEYLFYREEGWRYGAPLVVLFFYYNDVLYNVLDGGSRIPKPLLRFDGSRPEVANFPVPPRAPVKARHAAPVAASEGSAAVGWLGERLERSFPRAYTALSATGLWPPIRELPISAEFRVYMRNYSPEIQQAWAATGQILKALAQETARHGARLLVAYVPSRMEVNDRDWTLTQLRYGLKEGKWYRNRVLGRLDDICAREGIPILDLTPALRRAASAFGSGPYFATDSHRNALGQAVAARELATFVRSHGLVEGCPAPAVP